MAKSKKKSGKKNTKALSPLPDALGDRAHEVWLAGLGALDRARKEGAEGFDVLVKRGQKVRKKGGEAFDGILEGFEAARGKAASAAKTATASAADTVNRIEDRIESVFEALLAKTGIPSRAEVEALTGQIDALQARLAALTGAAPGAADPTVYRIQPHPDGWAVQKEGGAQASSVHGTKKEALSAGRKLAKANAPSRLVTHKADGSEQDTTDYDA